MPFFVGFLSWLSFLKMRVLSRHYRKLIFFLVALGVVGLGAKYFLLDNLDAHMSPVVELKQSYTFKGRDAQGVRGDIDLTLNFLSARKQPEVLIRGQRARARNKKTFLVFEVSLTNNSSQVLYLDLQDLVRWVEDKETKIAPQIHQGNLEIRPQSTKKSNLGFVVPQERKDFTFQVGELDGQKQTFTVKF